MASTKSVAILDDYANIAPKHFKQIGDLLIKIDSYPDTLNPAKPDGLEALIKRLEPYEIVSSMRERTPFSSDVLKRLPNLKLLLTTGMRNAGIDLKAASEKGVIVTGTKGESVVAKLSAAADYCCYDEPPPPAGQSTVIQHSWALLLSLCGRVARDDRALKTEPEAWQSGLMVSLPGKILGLVGLGKLGTMMGKVAVQSFGMNVIAWSENMTQEKADAAAEGAGLAKGSFKFVSKEELFKEADVVSLHVVLSDRSRGIVGKQELEWMKKSGVLLNTSRGGLIDEQALIDTLKNGGIEGFATDVFWEEPLSCDSPWRKVDSWAKSSTVLSPHMGYVNAGTMNRWYEEQAEILQRYLKGEELLNKLN